MSMAYIETIKKKKNNFYYLVQTIRTEGKYKKIRWFLGKGKIPQSKLNSLAESAKPKLEEKVNEIKQIRRVVELDHKTTNLLNNINKNYKKLISSLSKIEYSVIEKQHLINFTFNTNAIEGSTISLKDTGHILEDGISPEGKELREIHEVENTKTAYRFMKRYEGTVNVNFIKKIHYNLTYNILSEQAGSYRKIQVFMGGSKHTPTKSSEVSKEMISLIRWIKNHENLHTILLVAYVHHFFIVIHPFIDGNGRTGRLLLNFMLMKSGFPPICIRKGERIKYTDYLELARDGDISKFVNFIVKKVEEAYKEIVDNTEQY